MTILVTESIIKPRIKINVPRSPIFNIIVILITAEDWKVLSNGPAVHFMVLHTTFGVEQFRNKVRFAGG
jgi:hypothetical protein